MIQLTSIFKPATFGKIGIKAAMHVPCVLLAFSGAFIGSNLLSHNPYIELPLIFGGALVGEYIGSKLFCQDSCHDHKTNFWSNPRNYLSAVIIGALSLLVHMWLFGHGLDFGTHGTEHMHHHAEHIILPGTENIEQINELNERHHSGNDNHHPHHNHP